MSHPPSLFCALSHSHLSQHGRTEGRMEGGQSRTSLLNLKAPKPLHILPIVFTPSPLLPPHLY